MRSLRFNPLGGGAGSGSIATWSTRSARNLFQSPRRWGGVGLVFRWIIFASQGRVSIPSEVGRGRAPTHAEGHRSDLGHAGFNPLGGGAGSGSIHLAALLQRLLHLVSIPSEVGRGRAPMQVQALDSTRLRFNPLGGGAGSGSHRNADVGTMLPGFNPLGGGAGSGSVEVDETRTSGDTFQSPRRWGGVGLSGRSRSSRVALICFNPLGGGAGSGSYVRH